MRLIKSLSGKVSRSKLGDPVHHHGFGDGRVVAIWPDGRLLIRFNNGTGNQLVWPSFLESVNGHRS